MKSRPVFAALAAVAWSGVCVRHAVSQETTPPVNYEVRLAKHFVQHEHARDPQTLSCEHFVERCTLLYKASEYRYWLQDSMREKRIRSIRKAYDRVRAFMNLLRSELVTGQLVNCRDLEKDFSARDRLTTLIVRIEMAPFDKWEYWIGDGISESISGGLSVARGSLSSATGGGASGDFSSWWSQNESAYDEFGYGDLRIRRTERAFEIILKDGQQPYRIAKTLVQGIEGVSFEGPVPFSEDVLERWQESGQEEYGKLLSSVYRFVKAANQDQTLETVLDIVPGKDVMELLLLAGACDRAGLYTDGVAFTDALAAAKNKIMSIATKRAEGNKSPIRAWQLLRGIDTDEPQISSLKRSFMPYAFERWEDEARGFYYVLTPKGQDAIGRLQFLGLRPDVTSGTNRLMFKMHQEGIEKQYLIDAAAIETLQLDVTKQGREEN